MCLSSDDGSSSLQSLSSAGDSGTESPAFSPGLDIDQQKQNNNNKKQQLLFNEIQLANSLATSLTLLGNKKDVISPTSCQLDTIWQQSNSDLIDLNRRVSGSSLDSSSTIGRKIGGDSSGGGGTNSSASFASTSISSTEEYWPIQQQQKTAEQQQQFSRLPIFEQLSQCPF